MGQPITIVDAFTDRPFAGNPAAVAILLGAADESWMRAGHPRRPGGHGLAGELV